jgi:small subunit ribosomal protein S6
MEKNQYETVFILTPLLTEAQVKDAVEKFKKVLKENSAEIVHEENWGLKNLAYPIKKKSTGFYNLIEFKAPASAVKTLEIEYTRDEKVMRFLTIALDKYAIAYNEKKRSGKVGKKAVKEEENA